MSQSVSAKRFWSVNAGVVLIFLLLTYQLVQLTVIRQPSLMEAAEKQHQLTIKIPPLRGPIVDRRGRELASNLKLPSVYAVPRMLGDGEKEDLVRDLGVILKLPRDYLDERLSRNKAFVWIKRKISEEEAAKIQALRHPALGTIEEYRRFYPQGDLLSQVLGFTNIDNEGLEGVELFFNKELRGQEGVRYTRRDALGREIRAFELKTVPAVNGSRVVLTIDQYLQYLTERSLENAYVQWKAKGASAIIMNPKTGEILAMANRPGFDPNEFEKSSKESHRNRVLTDMYEPGSVFKIVATSAALNEGTASPEDVFFCENGQYRYGTRVLRDVHPYGTLTFEEVLIKSSNIGAVKIAATLQHETFQKYIDGFGFGKATGIDMPGEAPGFTRKPKDWSNTSPYNIPMGHEVMVTALQMANAYSVIANGGYLVKPYIIARVEDQYGVVLREKKPEVVHQIIKPEVAKKMNDILVRVVQEGTGKKAIIDGISVGGKTGTAQKVLPGGRGYSHNSFIASFIGFAPAEDPQLVMAVVLDDPKPSYYGGSVAAPVFKEVIEAGLLYMGYVPSNAEKLNADGSAPAAPANPPKPQAVTSSGRAE
ncbi:MAG TPA: penicillin-binding protein 2 [Verrucomicrobiae bacterium]|jgi:cell division protein FtsI (penicillin-binding protein 3)|nr:penicillin-binding protein 2 [Verrucomicrobiae bacterium]